MIFSESDVIRFHKKINKSGPCWNWTAGKFRGGYGKFWQGGRSHYANRISLIFSGVSLSGGLLALHKCDNPSCVRPDHLFAGTAAENTRDMISKGRASVRAGVLNGNARNPFSDVQEARRMVANGASQRDVAKRLSVSFPTVCNWCKLNKRKTS